MATMLIETNIVFTFILFLTTISLNKYLSTILARSRRRDEVVRCLATPS